jgi:chemotaxis response regulator CheB
MRPGRTAATLHDMTMRCLVVDDSARFLEVVTVRLTGDGLEVVGTARTSDEAMRQAERLRPDVVLIDISLGMESGFDLAASMADRPEAPAVVLISTRSEADYSTLITASRAVGFIPKSRLSVKAVQELVGSTGSGET